MAAITLWLDGREQLARSWRFQTWPKRQANLPITQDKSDSANESKTQVGWADRASRSLPSIWIKLPANPIFPMTRHSVQYITKDEADLRYANLKKWYQDHGHFWVGTGPYYLDKVFTTEKIPGPEDNPDFVDLADRWAKFSEPKLATTVLDGPGQVKAGEEAGL